MHACWITAHVLSWQQKCQRNSQQKSLTAIEETSKEQDYEQRKKNLA